MSWPCLLGYIQGLLLIQRHGGPSSSKCMVVAGDEGGDLTTSSAMAAAAASTSSPAAPPQQSFVDSAVHQLEVACAELKSLHETRAVYEKRGAVFFRTTVKAAAKSQLQELEKAKGRAKNAAS